MFKMIVFVLVLAFELMAPKAAAENLTIGALPSWASVHVVVTQPISAEAKSFLVDDQVRLSPGTYAINLETNVAGESYYLLPVESRDPSRGWGYTSTVSFGGSDSVSTTLMLLVKEVDGSILTRRAFMNQGSRSRTLHLEKDFSTTAGFVPLQIQRFRTEAEFRTQQAQHASAQASEEELRRTASIAQNDEKRKIGTRICQQRGAWIRVGFTEAVSPDNGKIQIRVVDEHGAQAPSIQPGGFQPSIIWDDPSNWTICE